MGSFGPGVGGVTERDNHGRNIERLRFEERKKEALDQSDKMDMFFFGGFIRLLDIKYVLKSQSVNSTFGPVL